MPTNATKTQQEPEPGKPDATPEEKKALDDLFSATYEELRRLAFSVKQGYANATLNPTALVDEAYIKLVNSPHVAQKSRLHFKRIAARAMRQILIEAARRRNALKRGGGEAVIVTLDDSSEEIASGDSELLALDASLEKLATINPRQAQLVEYRFFGGLSVPEVATLLDVSEATVLRDWRLTKAWLAYQVRLAK